jgi:hypothetical protein
MAKGRATPATDVAAERARRLEGVRELALDGRAAERFIAENGGRTREHLVAEGYINATALPNGTGLLTADDRRPAGQALLTHAKDVLFGLLFGDASTETAFDRVQQELLTLALPRKKAGALDFIRAATELSAAGTWQDPDNVSHDEHSDNVLLEVQFGETADELVGRGIVVALSLIKQPRDQRAGALRADDQRRGNDADSLSVAGRRASTIAHVSRIVSRRIGDEGWDARWSESGSSPRCSSPILSARPRMRPSRTPSTRGSYSTVSTRAWPPRFAGLVERLRSSLETR